LSVTSDEVVVVN